MIRGGVGALSRDELIARIVRQLQDTELRRQRFIRNNWDELLERAVNNMRAIDRGLNRTRVNLLRGNEAWRSLADE